MSEQSVMPKPEPAAAPFTAEKTGFLIRTIMWKTWCHHMASSQKCDEMPAWPSRDIWDFFQIEARAERIPGPREQTAPTASSASA